MTATITQARDEMTAVARTAWVTTLGQAETSMLYQDRPGDGPPTALDVNSNPKNWARLTIQHVTGGQSGLANGAYPGSSRKYTRTGFMTVQVFTPGGKGLATSDTLVQGMMRAFQGVATASGVWFRNTRSNEIGPDGSWYQVNVLVDFAYDEVA